MKGTGNGSRRFPGREGGRYLAGCPALQGRYTERETEQEARALIEDAIRLRVEDRL